MNKKRLMTFGGFIAIATPIVSLVSCAGDEDKEVIGMVLTNVNNPFFKTIKDEATKEAKAKGYELVVIDTGYDLNKESQAITQLVTMGAKSIIFNPMDAEGSAAAAKIAKNAKIPVITVDTNLKDTSLVNSFIATDNVKGAHDLAQWAIDQDKKNDHSATHTNSFTVLDGGISKIDGTKLYRVAGQINHPASLARWDKPNSFSSLVKRTSDADDFGDLNGYIRGEFKTDTANTKFLMPNTEPAIIYTENDPMAVGVINKLKQNYSSNPQKIKDFMIVSFDGSDAGIKLIKDGFLDATYAQKPIQLGKESVDLAIKTIKGDQVAKEKLLPGYVIDKSTVNK